MSIKYKIVKKKKFDRLENKNYFSNLRNYNTSVKEKNKLENNFFVIISIIIMISLKYYFNL